MKDFTNFKCNEERIETIKVQFASGESEAQIAFHSLVTYIIEEMEAHRDGDKGAPRGLMAAMKREMEISGFMERGTLAKSYMTPAFGLASAIHYGKASTVVTYLWDNFLDSGDGLEGSVVKGPLYTPGRLNACWGKANTNEDTPFSVDMEGIVATDGEKGERPWHTLTIPELKALNAGKVTSPKVASSLMRVLGDPSKLDKRPGSLFKLAEGLRKENEEMRSDIISDLAAVIEGFVEEQRSDLAVTLCDAEVEAATKRKLAAEKKRLEKAELKADAPISDQKVVRGEVATVDAPIEETVES